MMRRFVLVFALAGSFALVGSMADAASTGEADSTMAESERAQPCEKRVDGVLRDIYFRKHVSCRKATQVMTRYILHKKLPGKWDCTDIVSIGKCRNESVKFYGDKLPPSLAYSPGKRA